MPNPLATLCDDVLAVPTGDSATVQEVHLAMIHMLCEVLEDTLAGECA